MSEDFGGDFITMVDENGEEFVLEVLCTLDHKGKTYTAFLPGDLDENDPDYGMVLLRNAIDENGDEVYDTIDDDTELEEVYELFMRVLFDDEEDAGEDEEN